MQNYYLKSESDYQKQLLRVQRVKSQLQSLEKGTEHYNKKLKKLIELVLFTKAHAFCLDNKKEREKATKIIYDLLSEVELIKVK